MDNLINSIKEMEYFLIYLKECILILFKSIIIKLLCMMDIILLLVIHKSEYNLV